MFETARILLRAGLLAKLSDWWLWLEWWPRTWWSLLLSSMIICGDRWNLQKDKHHCNAPLIWALLQCGKTQSSPQWRQKKTHLEFTKKKHLKDPQTLINNRIWSDEPQFQASCLKVTSTAHHLQSTIPKVKCAVAASWYGAVFQWQGLWDSSE